jgi:pimeloyl-ACP methyl ester carboxylesterase
VLALFGTVDPVSRVEEQLPALRAAALDVLVERLDRASHYPHLDRPQFFVDVVLDWVERARSPIRT